MIYLPNDQIAESIAMLRYAARRIRDRKGIDHTRALALFMWTMRVPIPFDLFSPE